ncbi:atpase aaa : Uncharacterized protein OS=Cupriavidus sp. HMR-1 GN=D769_13266 PE=4 SV=1: AAA_23 [Gemmata massiliana]|uniref:Rad50/SbcC-type AAA domain-containing protein n=1 Tax=Gemmata massiliana TaxID=1210884 RepID=A0A6P2D260_9BACT|nr:AAA family ATPase [Gemmata massiliana]VTR94937.1 atpase aaa : Uncharacterized protein OS=Cupriavidus sp. HMR-1 GN=D769_13266 PE=4 SV=1: AAA_23 [Gemmata massiliana]
MARRKPPTRPGPYLLRVQLLRDRITAPDSFPYCLPAIRNLETLDLHPKVTFFVGENGAGKSTLLEAIAVECGLNPEGGSRNFNFATRASHSKLGEALRLSRSLGGPADSYFLRAESFFNVATEIERLDRRRHSPHHSSIRMAVDRSTNSPTGNRSSLCSRTGFEGTGYT